MRRLRLPIGSALLGFLIFCGPAMIDSDTKVVILGFDGVDPDLVREFMAQGRLPNLKKLSERGGLYDLGTTTPPESPVAWSSFHTGTNPGKHGIYDFLRRDPKKPYPYGYFPTIGTVDKVDPEFIFNLLPWKMPDGIRLLKGEPFWQETAKAGVRTVFLQAPVMFPAPELPGGYLTSGLTTPDIRATQATYHYFTTDTTEEASKDTEFGGKVTQIEVQDGRVETQIYGPWNPLVRQEQTRLREERDEAQRRLKDGDTSVRGKPLELKEKLDELDLRRYIEVPLVFELTDEKTGSSDGRSVAIELQGQRKVARVGEWSEWFDISFQITPIISVYGICKFLPREVGEQMTIYMSPIEMDPRNPPMPLSYPRNFTAELAEHVGLYKTRGWAAESAALKELRIDEKAYLEDQFEIIEKREAITLYTLKNKPWNLFISVLSAPDRTQHMFWRLRDPAHSLHDPDLVREYGDAIGKVYDRMDETVGKVLAEIGEGIPVLILSDHGFHSFRTGLNINTWLVENGFMFLRGQRSGQMKLDHLYSQRDFFSNVDWSRTKAYSLGLGLIFINLRDREPLGIVQAGEEYQQVKAEIREKLVQFVNEETGENVVDNVYDSEEVYEGSQTGFAPDLIVGFADGYRVSWQTALGAIPPGLLKINDQKWSGDHCSVDALTTSGFLVSSQKIERQGISIMDIAPTVLKMFGLPISEELDGQSLF